MPRRSMTSTPGEWHGDVRVVVLDARGGAGGPATTNEAECALVEEAPWLSVAAVDGPCEGPALELALACTLRVAGATATFAVSASPRLVRQVGAGRTRELALTGRRLDATEARALGLVERIAPGGALGAARDLAGLLDAGSQPAQLAVRRCVRAASRLPLREGIAFEAGQVAAVLDGDDAREGIAAFMERRRPRFGWASAETRQRQQVSRQQQPRHTVDGL
jgi:enoyl-CoA hydratase/carnithine racemase